MSFLNIAQKDLLFLRVLFEVLLETLVADQLFLELDGLLSHDILGVEGHEDGLASGLESTYFVPDDGNALEHVFTVEVFAEFLLEVLDAFDSLVLVRLDKGDNRSLLVRNETSCFFIGVICDRYVKVDDINDILKGWGSLGIASVELDDHVELADVEEMADRLDLVLGHIVSEDEGFHVESV
jgi:hypothetical protein